MFLGEYQKEYEIGDFQKKQMEKLGGGAVPEEEGGGLWNEDLGVAWNQRARKQPLGAWNLLEGKLH